MLEIIIKFARVALEMTVDIRVSATKVQESENTIK